MSAKNAAIVTGAGRGVGRAIALALSSAGHPVGLMSRSSTDLEDVAEAIQRQGGTFVTVSGDVTDVECVRALAVKTEQSLGPVGIAVACAGQARSAPIQRTTKEDFESLFGVNVVGTFHIIQVAAERMRAQNIRGRIIAVASTSALKGGRYVSAYSASKHAAVGLVRSAALELIEDGITVNALCPGWVRTPMFQATLQNISKKTGRSAQEAEAEIVKSIPSGRVLEPEEVASGVLYLVSDAASQMTGQTLVLDGGETIR